MLLSIPESLHGSIAQKNISAIQGIELAIYHHQKSQVSNEIMLNKNLFLFVREGEKRIAIFDETLALKKGQGAVLVKDTYLMSEVADSSGSFSSLMILVDDETLLKLWQAAGERFHSNANSLTSAETRNWFHFQQTPLIQSSIDTLDLYIRDCQCVPYSLLASKLQELLIYMLHSSESPHFNRLFGSVRDGNRHRQLRKFMEDNFHQSWSVEEFANHYGFSLSTFKRLFKGAYGKSPKHWINDRRLKQAIVEMQSRNVALTDLAQELGFCDSSQFSKAFRNKYKCPPSRYPREGHAVLPTDLNRQAYLP